MRQHHLQTWEPIGGSTCLSATERRCELSVITLFVIGSLYRYMALTVSFIRYYLNPPEAWRSQVVFYVFPKKLRICLCS